MPAKVTKIEVRRQVQSARETPIDAYLDEETLAVLYANWDDAWGESFKFRGGEMGITAELVRDAPEKEMRLAMGDAVVDTLLEVARTKASSY